MNRTFSLRWLLLLVTVACGLLGLVVNFPGQLIGFGWFVGALLPSIVLSLLLSLASSRPRFTRVCGLLGAIAFGFMFEPALFIGNGRESYWVYCVTSYLSVAMPACAGALITGGAAVWDDRQVGLGR